VGRNVKHLILVLLVGLMVEFPHQMILVLEKFCMEKNMQMICGISTFGEQVMEHGMLLTEVY